MAESSKRQLGEAVHARADGETVYIRAVRACTGRDDGEPVGAHGKDNVGKEWAPNGEPRDAGNHRIEA